MARRSTATEIKDMFAAIEFSRNEWLWRVTENPIHVWMTYKFARQRGATVPAWVLEYLDDCGRRLTAPDGTKSQRAISEALRLKSGGGPSSGKRAITERNRLALIERVFAAQHKRRMLETRTTDDEIFGEIGEMFHVSTLRARNIFYEWTDHSKAARAPRRRTRR
jgi:hypothetical protein